MEGQRRDGMKFGLVSIYIILQIHESCSKHGYPFCNVTETSSQCIHSPILKTTIHSTDKSRPIKSLASGSVFSLIPTPQCLLLPPTAQNWYN